LWHGVARAQAQAQAQATDDERGRTHFEAGRSYYEQARYDDAAREFQEAFQLSGRAALLLNLSQSYERGLHFDQAIAELQHYLQMVPDAPDRKTLEERIHRLEDLRTRLQTQPQAAGGQAMAPQPAPGVAPAAGQPAAAEAAGPAAAEQPSHERSRLALPGWVLVGSGGAVLIGSLVTGLMADSKHSALSRDCNSSAGCTQSDIDSGKTLSVVSTVLMFVGVVAAGVGATLLVLDAGDHPQEKPAAGAHARLSSGPTPLGLGAAIDF
jgi:tetratricopeptide (TPR) repeat protein